MRHSPALHTSAWLMLTVVIAFCIFTARSSAADDAIVKTDPAEMTAGVAQVFNVSIRVENLPSPNGAVGFEIAVTWDPSILEAINMTEVLFHSITPESEWDNIWKIQHIVNATGGYAKYVYTFQDQARAIDNGYGPISGNHTLAAITFRGKSSGVSAVNFPLIKIGDKEANQISARGMSGSVTIGNPAPTVTLQSPKNLTYVIPSVNLTATLSEPASWIGYSLDGATNITFQGSSNIGVSDGSHHIVVYANDTSGQMGASAKVYFTVHSAAPAFTHTPPTPQPQLVLGNYRWSFLFSASGIYDPPLNNSAYFWNFGDGSNATGVEVTKEYRQAGSFTVTLTVTDSAGNTAAQSQTINLSSTPEPMNIPILLIGAVVIPVAWVSALWYYMSRMRRKKEKI